MSDRFSDNAAPTRTDSRIIRRAESLTAEFKSRLDISTDAGKAELVRNLFALRNFDGGHLFIGLNNDGTVTDRTACPLDQLKALTPDTVQTLASNYASQKFSCEVQHVKKDDEVEYVEIYVDGGITVPVVCTKDAFDNGLQRDTVYFRTLEANGTYSTSKIRVNDWPKLMDICFRNREADIAGFLQRNFTEEQIPRFRDYIWKSPPASPPPAKSPGTTEDSAPPAPPPQPAPQEVIPIPTAPPGTTLAFMVTSRPAASDTKLRSLIDRFEKGLRQRGTDSEDFGTLFTLVEADPALNLNPDKEFIRTALQANPQLTGWPAWLDLSNADNADFRPKFVERGWETFAAGRWDQSGQYTDFWRIEPTGILFAARAYQDDLPDDPRKPPPKTQLDFGLPILRIAERFEAARQILLGLGAPDQGKAHFLFNFNRLAGRELTYWAQPGRYISPGRVATQDDVTIPYTLSLNAGHPVIVEATHRVVNELFLLFDGFQIGRSVTEDMVTRLLQRRL